MSPEFGSTCAIFPVDAETLRYLDLTGRPTETIELVDAYAREQGMFHDESSPDPVFSDLLELDLGEVVPSIAGPETAAGPGAALAGEGVLPRGDGGVRPRGRRADGRPGATRRSRSPSPPPTRRPRTTTTSAASRARRSAAPRAAADQRLPTTRSPSPSPDGTEFELDHGRVVIAAITSCTNTSNPSVMIGAGLLARNAVAARPDPQALGEDLAGAGLDRGHRLPRARRPDRVPRRAPVQPRRLRLHHLHRQLRAAGRRRSRRRSPRRTWRSAPCSPATATSRAGSTRT